MLRPWKLVLLTTLCACGPGARPDASWDEARLSTALSDASSDIRQRAAFQLGERRPDAAYWPLVKALGDPRWEVRANAARALGRVSRRDALVPLSHSLHDHHWWVRVKTVQALGERRDPAAAPFLSAALVDENESVSAAARRSLVEVGR
jgi:HEAT repeat protein